ncbi:MAG TPA: carboxypeptidase-like regulatory domain-containing protein [archaeon]|nr:carboxypeptidase-like regulatory domain-containing protein [archaeon]
MSLEDLKETFAQSFDSISEKVPHVPIVAAVLAIVVFGAMAFLLLPGQAPNASISIVVENAAGVGVRGAQVSIIGLSEPLEITTDKDGKAIFEAPNGSKIEVVVSKQNYGTEGPISATVGEIEELKFTLKAEEFALKQVTFTFVGPDSKKLEGKEVIATLSCTGSGVFEKGQYSTTSGELVVEPPQNCGRIIVNATASGFIDSSSQVLGTEQVISFKGIEKPKGGIQITVLDVQTKRFVDGIAVKIIDSLGIPIGIEAITSFGEVNFPGLEIGNYSAVIEDPAAQYATQSVALQVQQGEVAKKEVLISKDIKLRAKIKVLDGAVGASGALVNLFSADGKLIDTKATTADGSALFLLNDSGTYSFEASKDTYLPSAKNSLTTSSYPKGSEKEFSIALKKCTPQTCGIVKVRVFDEDNLPVENAAVVLLSKEGLVQSAYGSKSTDWNGNAEPFLNVANGSYIALLQKYPAESRSDVFEVDSTKINSLQAKLVIGNGILKISAQDSLGVALGFAQADVFTSAGQKLGTVSLDAKGEGTFSIKADKSVYAIIRKDGFARFVSAAKQIFPDKTVQIIGKLEQQITAAKPSIEFVGLFNSAGQIEKSLKAGGTYYAKFKLLVPSQKSFSQVGSFVRVGQKQTLEEEIGYISQINAPLSLVSKGATYNPPSGNDFDTLTNGNALWANLEWKNLETGTYEFEAEIKILQGATKSSPLPINYRAWGVESDKFRRDPLDSFLGEAATSAQKAALYAQTYEKIFLVGLEELCDLDFCTTVRVFDQTSGLYLEAPYKLRTFSPYNLEVEIAANSAAIRSNGSITIKNTRDGAKIESDIAINSYSLQNADSQNFSANTPAFSIEKVLLGDLRQKRSISAKLVIEPKAAIASALQFSIVSGNSMVFDKLIPFTTLSEEDINIAVSPRELAAFIPLDINVLVSYGAGDKKGLAVDGARVVARRISPDGSETRTVILSDAKGSARVQLPASSPGTRVIISVEKAGAGSRAIEMQISSSVVKFSPAQIKVALNRQTQEQLQTPLLIESKISQELVVKKLRVTGNFRGILDSSRMDSFLSQYSGSSIAKDPKQIQLLTALGSEAQFLDSPLKLTGNVIAEFSLKQNSAISWISQVPLEAAINLAELPTNAPCINLSKKEWNDSTLGSRAYLEFEIENNCIAKNNERLDLAALQGQVDWQGSDGVIGQVELTITDPQSGQGSSAILQQGIWSRLSEKLEAGKIYPARLTFVPKADTLGKRAQFDVQIDAQMTTNEGAEFVGASNDIEADIVVANLDQCVEITPHPEEGITIDRYSEEQEFTVSTQNCGPIDIDIRFCEAGKDFCRGGSKEGGIKLTPWSFTRVQEDTRTAKVQRQQIPGFYGITVEARPSGGSWRQVAEIDAIVEPEEGEYFTLDKYEFTIIGKGSKDDAALANSMLQETVQVRANLCEWKEAQKNSGFSGQQATVLAAGAIAGAAAGYIAAAVYAFSALAATGVGILVLAVFVLIATLFGGDDPCKEFTTNPLQDYVINLAGTPDQNNDRYLPPDALDILSTDSRIKGTWNTTITDAIQKTNKNNLNGMQIVGVVFENLNAVSDRPIYAVATMRAKEHIHGDLTHQNASVQCGSRGSKGGNFGQFWINPGACNSAGRVYDTTYSQKFHLKFKVSEEKVSLPPISFDTQSCESGVDIGRTGSGALPRIKLNWSWKDTAGGISYNQCDAQNPQYIYCDATQFTIELNKKLYYLYEFLQANNFDLGCPTLEDEKTQAQNELNTKSATRQVLQGSIGLSSSTGSEEANSIRIVAEIKNLTSSDQNAIVNAYVTGTTGFSHVCTMDVREIVKNSQKSSSCTIDLPGDGVYSIYTAIQSASIPSTIDSAAISSGIVIGSIGTGASAKLCSFKTTETYVGSPQIMRFVEGKSNIKWTSKVPDKDALLQLLIFDAYLMKDNYSEEFFADFSKYYTQSAFEDTDFYFHQLSKDSAGKSYGFNKFMENEKFVLTRKYVQSAELPSAGLYRVELAGYFNEADWRFFELNGEPRARISVVVYKKDDPYPNSVFYSMPFDGLIGVEAGKYKRANYGVAYSNTSQEVLAITSDQQPVKTYEDAQSSPVTRATVNVERDLYNLNTSASTRGMILEIANKSGKSASITFQPSHATPVMFKVSQPNISQEKFASYYTILESNTPLDVGNTLAYWDGAGACLDFSGQLVTEAFYQKPDRAAVQSDKLIDWQNAYATEWNSAIRKGDTYLRTIFYTDPKKDIVLKASPAGGAKGFFYTADSSGQAVGLNGVSGMPYNNFASGSVGTINSVSDALEMVGSGKACITNSGESVKIWWNPQAVYSAQGVQRSISEQVKGLVAGNTCIG